MASSGACRARFHARQFNFQAGAATHFSGVLAAGFVGVAVLALAPPARYVPKASLAALLMPAAARLIDVRRLAYTIRASRMDAGVLTATAVSAVAFGLNLAILIGVALSILLFVPRAAKLKAVERWSTPATSCAKGWPPTPKRGLPALRP